MWISSWGHFVGFPWQHGPNKILCKFCTVVQNTLTCLGTWRVLLEEQSMLVVSMLLTVSFSWFLGVCSMSSFWSGLKTFFFTTEHNTLRTLSVIQEVVRLWDLQLFGFTVASFPAEQRECWPADHARYSFRAAVDWKFYFNFLFLLFLTSGVFDFNISSIIHLYNNNIYIFSAVTLLNYILVYSLK